MSVLSREYASFLKNMIMGDALSYKATKRDQFDLLNPLGHELLKNKVYFNVHCFKFF